MKYFVTPAQWRVMKYFWRTKQPFTIDDLWDAGILHGYRLSCFCLYRMLLKRQIIPYAVTGDHAVQFVGAIESRKAWQERKRRPTAIESMIYDPYIWDFCSLNDYEQDDFIAEIEELLETRRAAYAAEKQNKEDDDKNNAGI